MKQKSPLITVITDEEMPLIRMIDHAKERLPEDPLQRLEEITSMLMLIDRIWVVGGVLLQIVEDEKLYLRAGFKTLNEWATATFDRGRSTIYRWRQTGKVVKVIEEDELEDLHQAEVLELVPLLKVASKPDELKEAVNEVLDEAKSSSTEGLSPSSIKAIVEKRVPPSEKQLSRQKTVSDLANELIKKLKKVIEDNKDSNEVELANSLLSNLKDYAA